LFLYSGQTGFEQTVLQILSIIRGEKIAGLKEKPDAASAKNAKGRALNLQQKWEQHSLQQTKRCATADLVLLMCSATLSRAVKMLALPLLGRSGAGFLVVDADSGTVDTIKCEADIMQLGKDGGKLDGSSATSAASAVGDAGPVQAGAQEGDRDKRSNGALDKGAVVEAPSQLAQYFMMVTCKWRLAALMSFLRTHADQKVVVFLSTCDAVDYLSLLLREMDWPLELDGGLEYKGKRDIGEDGGQGRSIEEEEAAANLSALSASASQTLEPLECTFTGMLGKGRHMYRLHGNVPQQVRKTVYQQFCEASKGILLCTDVAARGLDLPNVDWILQYDPPCETADYVHRIGRTARKGEVLDVMCRLASSDLLSKCPVSAYPPALFAHLQVGPAAPCCSCCPRRPPTSRCWPRTACAPRPCPCSRCSWRPLSTSPAQPSSRTSTRW
jgi:superfamily II DNA/RNA helicase